jgi:hypothetical protein
VKKRVLAMACASLATAALAAGCSSGPHAPSWTQLRKQQGTAAGRALSVGHGTDVAQRLPTVRLGLLATVAGGSGLAGQGLGYFGQELGNQVTLDVIGLGTEPAQAAALASGRLDAAYVSPVAAIDAWQDTHGHIRVISGAATSRGATTAVLVVTTRLLAAHPNWVNALLRAQIRAGLLLDTDPVSGQHAAATELAALAGRPAAAQAAAQFPLARFTDNPQAQSVLTQAEQAGTMHSPANALVGLYDLAPLNQLLRASGLEPITS